MRLDIANGETKHKIMAVGAKIKRCKSRIRQYQEKWMFINNQGQFFND